VILACNLSNIFLDLSLILIEVVINYHAEKNTK
jgi:hypothetical protein